MCKIKGDCDATIFNYIYDPQTRLNKWVHSHIYGIHWEDRHAANIGTGGMSDGDTAFAIIPFLSSVEKTYKKPIAFSENPANSFTLRPGDYIVKGIVHYNGSIAKLGTLFDDIMMISVVDTYDYGSKVLQHWEVSGKRVNVWK